MAPNHREEFETRAVRAGEHPPPGASSGDVVSPIHTAAAFSRPEVEATGGYNYSRGANPTRDALEDRVAALEGADHAVATGSGMGASATLCLSVLEPGDHVVAPNSLYGGTRLLLEEFYAGRLGVDVEFVDATDTDAVAGAVRPGTALVWAESPTNPLLGLCDVRAVADVAADAGALLAVDNTFASPYLQTPLSMGADVVVESTTKYLNGHSDSIGGVLATDDGALAERLLHTVKYGTGAVLSPFEAYLVLRGTKTLPARMEAHGRNAGRVASFLESRPGVRRVYYPGLESHPQHDLARRQMSGFGGMLSFEIEGGRGAAERFLSRLETFSLAVSLGGVESLIAHVTGMTHRYLPEETKGEMGITDSLIRVSVGIEGADDLLADLERGLEAARDRRSN